MGYYEEFKSANKDKIQQESFLQKEKIYNEILPTVNQTNKKILLVGEVQSGKTSTFIGLIAKLFDETNCNFVSIFAGVTHKLTQQTYNAVSEIFGSEIVEGSFKGCKPDFDRIENKLKNGGKIILVSLKHYKHIENISAWLNKTECVHNPLFIDDEGDQATFDNIVKYKKTGNHAATYKSFSSLLERKNCGTYCGVTATPYAHVLVDNNSFSLKPDRVFLIPSGDGYMSIQDVFLNLNNNVVAPIDEREYIESLKKDELPMSLMTAIIQFLYNSYCYREDYGTNGNNKRETQMIINTDRRIKIHNDINEKISDFLYKYKDSKILQDEIIKKFSKDEDETKEIKRVVNHILSFNEYKIRVYNSANQLEKLLNIENGELGDPYNIFIGKFSLARGIAFPNLMTFYMWDEKLVHVIDNSLQLARFLGYRKKYIHLLKLYITKNAQQLYASIADADCRLREIISEYQLENKDFSTLPRIIEIHHPEGSHNSKTLGTRETVAKQVIETNYNDLCLSNEDFNFTSDTDKELNDEIGILFKFLMENVNDSTKNLGKNLGDFPYIMYENLKSFLEASSIDVSEILKKYSKRGGDFIKKFVESNNRIYFSIMGYEYNKNDLSIVGRNVSYISGLRKYSYFRTGYRVSYIGDNNWNTVIKDAYFFQIFPLCVPENKKPIFKDDFIYKIQVVAPEGIHQESVTSIRAI